jgi:hypothetical protein
MKAAIVDMRKEMENIYKMHKSHPQNPSSSREESLQKEVVTVSFVIQLRFTLQPKEQLKQQIHQQQQMQQHSLQRPSEEPPHITGPEDDSESMYQVLLLRKQVQELNSTSTKLKADMLASMAEVPLLLLFLFVCL